MEDVRTKRISDEAWLLLQVYLSAYALPAPSPLPTPPPHGLAGGGLVGYISPHVFPHKRVGLIYISDPR